MHYYSSGRLSNSQLYHGPWTQIFLICQQLINTINNLVIPFSYKLTTKSSFSSKIQSDRAAIGNSQKPVS